MFRILSLFLAMFLVSGCAQGESWDNDVSMLPHIIAAKPAIACMEKYVLSSNGDIEWKGGVPTGPLYEDGVIEECLESAGLSEPKSEPVQLEVDPVTESKKYLVFLWAMMMGDRDNALRSEGLDKVVDYASCIENQLRTKPAFLSGEEQKVQNAVSDAQESCSDHVLAKLARKTNVSAADYAQQDYRLAGMAILISQANINFILEKLGRKPAEWQRNFTRPKSGALPVVAPPPMVVPRTQSSDPLRTTEQPN